MSINHVVVTTTKKNFGRFSESESDRKYWWNRNRKGIVRLYMVDTASCHFICLSLFPYWRIFLAFLYHRYALINHCRTLIAHMQRLIITLFHVNIGFQLGKLCYMFVRRGELQRQILWPMWLRGDRIPSDRNNFDRIDRVFVGFLSVGFRPGFRRNSTEHDWNPTRSDPNFIGFRRIPTKSGLESDR